MESEDYKIEELKHLLLQEDRATIDSLKKEIAELKKTLHTKDKLDEKVGPIIKNYLDAYTDDIPSKLGPTITKSLKNQIADSRDDIVDILYPIMGLLIKKYIQAEFKKLSEQINKQLEHNFSFKSIKRKFKSIFTGVKEQDIIIEGLAETKVEEVFIIEKHSGILKGSFSNTNTIDKDVLSGMLTAIKSFVEDALKTGGEQLETIEYGSYNIHIQNFNTYYIAVVAHGTFDNNFKEDLVEELYTFSDKFYKPAKSNEELSKALEKTFSKQWQ